MEINNRFNVGDSAWAVLNIARTTAMTIQEFIVDSIIIDNDNTIKYRCQDANLAEGSKVKTKRTFVDGHLYIHEENAQAWADYLMDNSGSAPVFLNEGWTDGETQESSDEEISSEEENTTSESNE